MIRTDSEYCFLYCKKGKKMKFERQFTKKGNDAYAGMEFKTTTSEIKNPDGTVVFSAPNIAVSYTHLTLPTTVIV